MRVLIFGASGMFGHKLFQQLSPTFDVFATIRSDFGSIKRFGIFDEASIIQNVNVTDIDSVVRAIDIAMPDCVINAVGIIKQVPTAKDVIQTLSVNSIFPHRLAELSAKYGFRLITISTDCVFGGEKGNYSETDIPNARDLYGMSKYLGELAQDNCITIRTSIIGRELATQHSIVEWFLSQRDGKVDGFTNVIYTGFPSTVLADIISNIVTDHPQLTGVRHVSSDPITKFELLTLLNKYYQANVTIEPSRDLVSDRSLDSTKFRSETGFQPVPWEDMIERMAGDPTPYATIRNS